MQVHPPGAGAPAPAEVPVAAAPAQQAPAPAPAREPVLALPRVVWVALALAAIIWQLAAGRSGVALLALAALAPLALAPIGRHGRRRTPAWLACALAPVLGTLGLAAVFPALAGQRRRWPERAAMGALGFWWLTLAEPLLARRLWAGPPAGVPARAAWEGSLGLSAAHVVGPCFAGAVLLGAAVWACGALALPWVVRGVNAPFDLLAACAWSIALAIMASAAAAHGGAHGLHGSPRGLVLGSVLAALFAVGARAVRGPV